LIANDELEDKFALLEAGPIEDDLAELKKNRGEAASPKSLPEGRSMKDAIDLELEELRQKTRE